MENLSWIVGHITATHVALAQAQLYSHPIAMEAGSVAMEAGSAVMSESPGGRGSRFG